MWCCSKPIAIEPTLKLCEPVELKDIKAVVESVAESVAESIAESVAESVVQSVTASQIPQDAIELASSILDPTTLKQGSRPTDALRFAPPLEILEALTKHEHDRREFVRTFMMRKKRNVRVQDFGAEPTEPIVRVEVPTVPEAVVSIAEPVTISSLALRAAEETRVQDSVDDALTCESGEVSDSESSGCDWFKALNEQD